MITASICSFGPGDLKATDPTVREKTTKYQNWPGFADLSSSVLNHNYRPLRTHHIPKSPGTSLRRRDVSATKTRVRSRINPPASFCLESQAISLRVPQTADWLLDFPDQRTAWSIVCCYTKPRIEGDIYETLGQQSGCFHYAIRKCLFFKFFCHLRQGAQSGERAFRPVGSARSFAVGRCCSAATAPAAEDELASHQPRRSSAGQEGTDASEKGEPPLLPLIPWYYSSHE